jgi:hypothetical protein
MSHLDVRIMIQSFLIDRCWAIRLSVVLNQGVSLRPFFARST